MNAIERRIAALEVHDRNLNRRPVQIDLVAGAIMGRREADARPMPPLQFGAVITRIKMIGVLPDAEIIPIG